MPTLTIMPSGKTIEANEGANVLEVLLGAGEPINHKCEGKAECGSCHIFVQEGRKGISRMTPEENAKLDTIIGVGSKSRLACQITLGTEPVTVELLGEFSGF
ncbi:2Fe-2S iron-sulfur cluster-binding protein [Methyloceanibacter sp. wino2]|uniref:2Fe-2S iron-sulfur cluster-binding protein n=1 Tax=Methyloceanibacter sp. wino2 TaxID=2170729 RepID=UPI000D3E4239|nr:2Fe-2S iron-sulfur cluster-binding protein [Methyloceanibacter sp. wino2]